MIPVDHRVTPFIMHPRAQASSETLLCSTARARQYPGEEEEENARWDPPLRHSYLSSPRFDVQSTTTTTFVVYTAVKGGGRAGEEQFEKSGIRETSKAESKEHPVQSSVREGARRENTPRGALYSTRII